MRPTTLASLLALLAIPAAVLAQQPCYEPSVGTDLQLGDDVVATNRALGFAFPLPGGGTTNIISVSSNGFVWLANNNTNGCCDGDVNSFLSSPPRIAPCWTDLNPGAGGAVHMNTFPANGSTPARAVVTWLQVPEYGASNTVTAQLTLLADGSITTWFDVGSSISSHTVLTGVTRGNNAPANSVNLSAVVGSNTHSSGTNPTVHDLQTGAFDLAGITHSYTPNGNGGYLVQERPGCQSASFVPFGGGCPRAGGFYELFGPGNALDLGNHGFYCHPNGSGGWLVLPTTGQWFSGFSNNLNLGDDQNAVARPLPFVWVTPQGSTTSIDVNSNGCIYPFSGLITGTRCCAGNVAQFLDEAPSIAALWQDLDPAGAGPGNGVFYDVDPSGQAVYVTWNNVPVHGAPTVRSTFQVMLHMNGAFELRYQNVAMTAGPLLVGWSNGNGAADPGPRDLTAAAPFSSSGSGHPLALLAQGPPRIGQNITMQLANTPGGATAAMLIIGNARQNPAIDLTGIGMPGCTQYVTLDASLPFAPQPGTISVAVPNNPLLAGLQVHCQAAVLVPGINALGAVASNAGTATLGS